MKTNHITSFLVLLSTALGGFTENYYVATQGNNSNPGTQEKPFASIQYAADRMKAGDNCFIRGGVYTESVNLRNDGTSGAPLTFSGFPGETALLTAADKITNWKKISGNIYEAPIGWDLGMGENQVYVNGVWAHEARWPNITQFQDDYPTLDNRAASTAGYDISNWDKFLNQKRTVPLIDEPYLGATLWPVKVYFGEGGAHRGNSALGDSIFEIHTTKTSILNGKPRDYWKGTGFYSPGWWFASGVVIDNSWDEGAEFNFKVISKGLRWVTTSYFFGHKDFIDKPHEWVIKDGKIVMMFAAGEDPNTMDIRAKRRVNLINVCNRTAIHIKNLSFHGTGIQLDSANSCVVDNCHFKYLSHYELIGIHEYGNGANTNPDDPILPENKYQRGIRIGGSNNKFVNSSIEYSAANGLIMRGTNNIIENNYFRMIGYQNSYAAPLAGLRSGDLLKRNTIDIAGRSAINGATGGKVLLNHFKNCMATSGDGGVLYTWGQYPLNMEIAYNWFNNVHGRPALYLYCDAGAYHYSLHHNVFMQANTDRFVATACQGGEHYNNTWVCPYVQYGTFEQSYKDLFQSVNADGLALNNLVGTKGLFIDSSWNFQDIGVRDFRLRADSKAIDAGVPIQGITDGYVGKAPDLGAYEYGGEAWVPGHTWGVLPKVNQLWSSAKGEPLSAHHQNHDRTASLSAIRFNAAANSLYFNRALIGGKVYIMNLQGRTVKNITLTSQTLSLEKIGSGMFYYEYRGKVGMAKGSFMVAR